MPKYPIRIKIQLVDAEPLSYTLLKNFESIEIVNKFGGIGIERICANKESETLQAMIAHTLTNDTPLSSNDQTIIKNEILHAIFLKVSDELLFRNNSMASGILISTKIK